MKRVAMSVCAATIGLGALIGTAGTASAQFDFKDKRSPEQKCHDEGGTYVSTEHYSSCKYGKPDPTNAEKCQEGGGAVHNRPDGYQDCIGGQHHGDTIKGVTSAPADDDQQGLVPFLVTTLVGE